ERISVELDAAGARAAVAGAYDDFLVLNPELLDLCTAWQMRSIDGLVTLNDHTDQAYDALVLDRFTDFDRRAGVVCADLAAAMPRFQRYRERLTAALSRSRCGAVDYLTDNLASYHAVWFQLHEDLLNTLGIPRH
ncbi:MAG TPA: transcriptional regulator, partial [Catenuloplanes sp.]